MNLKPAIHVVDDDDSLRTSLLRLLRGHGFEAVGYASTGEFLLHRPADRHGCILLDVRMPGPSGVDLQTVLNRQEIFMPVVFMTGHADVVSCLTAMKGGAIDYLEKPIEPETLLGAIRRALAQDEQNRATRREHDELKASFASLSQRERQIFDHVVSGKLNKQIAGDLGVAERTVKAQRASLMVKLRVDSVAGLGRLAERLRVFGDERRK